MKTIIGVNVSNRFEEVDKMQNVLTEHGFIIKTRIGMHEQKKSNSSEEGVILLELNDDVATEGRELESKLKEIEGLEVKVMSFS